MFKKKRGFILSLDAVIYLLIAVIFVGLGTYGVSEYLEFSRRNAAKNEMATISSAVSHYYYDMGNYPGGNADSPSSGDRSDSLSILTTTDQKQINDVDESGSLTYGPWMAVLNNDPWGDSYGLDVDEENQRFVVYSKGGQDGATYPKATDTPSDASDSSYTAIYIYGR